MEAGERHLTRAGEIEVVGREVVDLVGMRSEEPGAGHDLGLYERGSDERFEAPDERPVERHVHQA